MRDLAEAPARTAPIAAGAVLVGVGALVMQLRPHLLDLPGSVESDVDARERFHAGDRAGAAAQAGRDTLLGVLPPNLLTWIGRVLMLAGASVDITRQLDRLVDDEGLS